MCANQCVRRHVQTAAAAATRSCGGGGDCERHAYGGLFEDLFNNVTRRTDTCARIDLSDSHFVGFTVVKSSFFGKRSF